MTIRRCSLQPHYATRYNALMPPRPIITLLTDFGEKDTYVGAMKGVILSIAPDAQIVDISHEIAPQDIKQAAAILDGIYQYYPEHSVHVIVVDPGVGSERKPIALRGERGTCLAPDNGVLSYIHTKEPHSPVFALDRQEYWLPLPSNTFHGRDIFSPVAAHLSVGVPIQELGTPIIRIVTFPLPSVLVTETTIKGEVVKIDNFGNALTNIGQLQWLSKDALRFTPQVGWELLSPVTLDARQVRIICGWHTLTGIHQNYTQVAIGQLVAVVGSNKELEIAVNQGRASDALSIQPGHSVIIQFV